MRALNIGKNFRPDMKQPYLVDIQVVKHSIEERLKILKGELAYDTHLGIPIGFNRSTIDIAVLDIIRNTYGVTNATIKSSQLKSGRFYSADVYIETVYNKNFQMTI